METVHLDVYKETRLRVCESPLWRVIFFFQTVIYVIYLLYLDYLSLESYEFLRLILYFFGFMAYYDRTLILQCHTEG